MTDVNLARDKRAYHSRVREDSARRTRQAIVRAATDLFLADGYVATSLADVAAAAGTARPTVSAVFGSKPALLRAVLDQALAGDDEPVPVAERPWFRPVWDAPTQVAALEAYAEVCRVIAARAARLFEVVRRAADSAPEAADLWQALQDNRRAGAAMVVHHVRRLGPLDRQLSVQRATDLLWFFNDPAHYSALVVDRGWAERRFVGWLADQMKHALQVA